MSENEDPQIGVHRVVMPCPFCGGDEAKIVWSGAYPYMVRCICGCELVLDAKATEDMAWAAWKKRRNHHSVNCPQCHSESVNMLTEPFVQHSPAQNGWYGQLHTVTIPMECEHGHGFLLKIEAYKCRVISNIEMGIKA